MSGIGYVSGFSSFPELGRTSKGEDRKGRKDRDKKRERRQDGKQESKSSKHERNDENEAYEYHSRRHPRSRSPEHGQPRTHSREEQRQQKRRKQEDVPSSRHHPGVTVDDSLAAWDPVTDERVKAKEDRRRAQVEEKNTDSESAYGSTSKLWYIDKKGDSLNIVYGGLHPGDGPKFHRSGKGRVLGLSSLWNIKRGSGRKEIEIGRRDEPKVSRYVDSKSYRLLTESRRRLVPIPSKPHPSIGDFIPVKRLKSSDHTDPRETYRSITVEDVPRESDDDRESDSRSSVATSSDDEAEGPALPAEQETIRELEEELRKAPTDESSWLRLIELSTSFVTVRTKRATHARIEVALSIIQRAWDAHTDNQGSVRLWLLYLGYGGEIWTKEDSEKQWRKMAQVLGHEQAPSWKRAIVWMAWLDWKLGTCLSISDALHSGKRALSMLQGPQYEMAQVRICWRIAIFLREAGFLELAMAILQAQLELSYFCPSALSSQPFSQKIEQFELFWEAEVGRAGDDDAIGWDRWEELGRPEPRAYSIPPSIDSSDIQDPYQHWFSREKELDTSGTVPTRTFSDDEQDPYSTILFSDIHALLSDIRRPPSKEYLRLVFLSFLGLNVPGLGRLELDVLEEHSNLIGLLDDAWTLSGRVGWVAKPDDLFPSLREGRLLGWESYFGAIISLERPKTSVFGPVKDWALGRHYLEGVDASCRGRTWELEEIQGVDVKRIKNAFLQLRVDSPKWDEMSSAFEAAINIKSAIKMSKQRLEKRSNSSTHWRTHIRLERIRQDYEKASKMYQMALGPETRALDIDSLYVDAIEYFWFLDDNRTAQSLLRRALSVDKLSSSGLHLLRARKRLEELFSSTQDATQTEPFLRLQFFFEVSIGSIQDAVSGFWKSLDKSQVTARFRESLLSWLCITLRSLAQLRGTIVPPALLTESVTEAVKLYPDNTILLSLFLECERGQGIWGRVRTLLDDTNPLGSSSRSLSRLAWEIWAEGQGYGPWEIERVRNKLESALGSPRAKKSVVLWRIYLTLEMRNELSKAKNILIRAIDECWWAKELYMMAFGPLRSVFSARELNALVEMMVDRGIRMRRDLGEFIKGWIDPSAFEDDQGSNGGDMEVEALIQAREQAKPF